MEDKKEKLPSTRIQWYPVHMAKAKKEIIESLKLVDVVIEILDARVPKSSINPDIQEYLDNKNVIELLNKADLADENETKKWIKYFKDKGKNAIPCNSKEGKGIKEVVKKIEEVSKSSLETAASKGRIGKTIKVMVVGIPNVGRSSFINRISNKATAKVGNRPGVTKQKQWINVNDNIELLDTPGILWPKFENQRVALNLASIGTIKDENLDRFDIAYNLIKILIEHYPENVLKRYRLEEIEDALTVIDEIALKRGAIKRGGTIEEERVANLILDDFRSGRLGNITLEKI